MPTNAEDYIIDAVDELAKSLSNYDETVCNVIAETNAITFGPDECNIVKARFTGHKEVKFEAEITLSGEQDPDRAYSGDTIHVKLNGVAKDEGGKYKVVDYKITECKVEYEDEDE
jgi:hypothetical protein